MPDIRQYAADPFAFLNDLLIRVDGELRKFGDVMAPYQRATFRDLMPSLRAVAHGQQPPIPRFWIERTKGGSKDSDLAAALLWLLAFSPRMLHVQIGAADRDQADELRRAAKTWLSNSDWLAQLVEIQTWSIVNKHTGSEAEIIPADVAGSHGARPDVLILNELSHVSKEEFAQNLLDNAEKVPNGIAVIATNAGCLNTWQHAWRELARVSPSRWAFHKFDQPAPWIREEGILEAQKRNPPARFLRLWKGVWASGDGDALDPTDIDAAITLPGPMLRRDGNLEYIAGLDLGLKQDHAGFVVLGCDVAAQRVKLALCESWSPAQYGGQVRIGDVEAAVLNAHYRFRLGGVIFDPWQAAFLAERLSDRGIIMMEHPFTNKNLDTMATKLLETFRNRRIDLYDDKALIRDLSRLSIVERQQGFRLQATRDEHGHCDRATALAICLPMAWEWMDYLARRDANEPQLYQYITLA